MAANGKAAPRAALVTGAGKNIGRACVLGLAEDGFNVAINGSSDKAACEKVANEAGRFGVKAIVIMGDIGKPNECKRIADEAIKAFGAIDALLNNAALRPNSTVFGFTRLTACQRSHKLKTGPSAGFSCSPHASPSRPDFYTVHSTLRSVHAEYSHI